MSRKTKEKKRHKKPVPERHIPSWIVPTGLIGLVVVTFLIRTLPQWDIVLRDGLVWFKEVDAWYHMRLVENMMVNFPWPLERDMLILFPDGMNVGYFPLLSWIVVTLGQVFDYKLVGAFLPPILGALTLVPVFLICKTLWKDWVGLIACMLISLLPTEFFHRSLLGFTDHHVLEVFFMAWTVLFLLLMQKSGKLRWIILSGVCLGLYLATWAGGMLLVVLIFIWFLIASIYDLSRKRSIRQLVRNITIVFGIGLIIYFPNVFFIEGVPPYLVLMGLATISPLVLLGFSKFLNWKIITGLVIGCLLLMLIIIPREFPTIAQAARAVIGFASMTTIMEAIPSDPRLILSHYGISFVLFLGGLAFAIGRRQNLLVVIWTLLLFVLVLGQRRWSYYFVLTNSILAGYFIYLISTWVHKQVRVAVVVVISVILLATTINGTIGISQTPGILNQDWYNTCLWLKANTPEIEGYYALEADKPDYGVASWWDYGSWITTIGHRVPISNPMAQIQENQWKIFLAHSEEEAEQSLEGIDYIIVSEDEITGKFYAIVRLSPYDEITWKPFIGILWDNEATGWTLVHQEGTVRIYGRTKA